MNILIVDDHAIVRTGIKLLLNEILREFNFYSAPSKDDALRFLKDVDSFNLIILDINMPDYNCENMIEICKIKHPEAKILILSMNAEEVLAKRYYKLGADGYLNKGADDEEIKRAIGQILSNKKYFSIEYLERLANESILGSPNLENPFEGLSHRELDVLKLLLEGKSIQDISKILSVQSSTVSTYKSRIFEKLNTDNLIEIYDLYKLTYKV